MAEGIRIELYKYRNRVTCINLFKTSEGIAAICHSCANRNLLIIKQVPDAIGARMTEA